jgi:hypothetical protein
LRKRLQALGFRLQEKQIPPIRLAALAHGRNDKFR